VNLIHGDLSGAEDSAGQVFDHFEHVRQGDSPMRPSKFTQDQIMQALRQVKAGTPAAEVSRKLGITETTFYRWRGKYGGATSNESREVRALRDENQKLKQIVANLLLDKQGSIDFLRKK
jgi:putative transposase